MNANKRKLVLLEAFYRKVKVFKELYGSETPSVREGLVYNKKECYL